MRYSVLPDTPARPVLQAFSKELPNLTEDLQDVPDCCAGPFTWAGEKGKRGFGVTSISLRLLVLLLWCLRLWLLCKDEGRLIISDVATSRDPTASYVPVPYTVWYAV